MGNGLTLTGPLRTSQKQTAPKTTASLGFSYAMGDFALLVTQQSSQVLPRPSVTSGTLPVSIRSWRSCSILSQLDETDATTIILDYDLGGGASAFAAMHDKAGTADDLTTVGLNFASP